MTPFEGDHARLADEAVRADADGYRLLVAGRSAEARAPLREAAELYRRSWEAAPPGAVGRLVGMLKAAVLAGELEPAAAYALRAVGERADTPTSAYAVALAALASGDDERAAAAADGMRAGSDAFDRTADAIAALAAGDAAAYARALAAIVADFEGRDQHLTGVRIADTALVLERLAARRGLAAGLRSELLPAG